ncbi:MAG: hypothetical protein GY719_24890 [bacterium]|nr:hypothetical protein [bacterium]
MKYHKRIDYRALDVFVDAVASATPGQLEQAASEATEQAEDYGNQMNRRPIWRDLAALLRKANR